MKSISSLGLLFALAVACQTPSNPSASLAPSAGTAKSPQRPTPAEALDGLDTRKPVPLLPMMAEHQKANMRDHLVVVRDVVTAVANQDFDKAARAAERMGYSETMGRMCEHMGAGAPGFTEQALAFHRSADRIAEAARAKDATAVLAALGTTLSACTTCHETYKQKLVDTLPK